MNAISTPICSSLPTTIREPKNTASTIASAVRMSTAGSRLAESLPAHRLAFRCSVFLPSNICRLRGWRLSACTTRTPVMFSLSAPFTMDIAVRTRRNAFTAKGCHMPIVKPSMGSTVSVISPSFRFITSSATMMPARLSRSAVVIMTTAISSWSCHTSPCTRDIMRPTSVLS